MKLKKERQEFLPRSLKTSGFIVYLTCASVLFSNCKTRDKNSEHSVPAAMQQNDWFRGGGTDRFYLATLDSDEKIHSDYNARKGNQLLFGVGCNDEPEDPAAIVLVRKSPDFESHARISKRLFDRHFIHEFPWAADPKNPGKGECVILLGDPHHRLVVSNSLHNTSQGKKPPVVMQSTFAATSCVTAFFSWGSFLAAMSPAVAAASGPIGLPMFVWWAVSGTWFCGLNLKFLRDGVESFKSQENRNLLYRAFTATEVHTDAALYGEPSEKIEELKKSVGQRTTAFAEGQFLPTELKCKSTSHALCFPYMKAIKEREWLVTAALYNHLFVRTFNTRVFEKFEQGWSFDLQNQRFFDAVKSIQTDLAWEQERNFKSLPGFEAGNILIEK